MLRHSLHDTVPFQIERHPYPTAQLREAGCTGNCNQGRACDCVPNVPEPLPATPDNRPFWRVWAPFLAAVLITAACALPIILRGAGQ